MTEHTAAADKSPQLALGFDPTHPSNFVSAVIAVYNGSDFIAETLDSILAQTVRPAEVIVVNDGSTDNTVSIVEGYGDSVTLMHTQRFGRGAARNAGAARAKSNWLAFCDHDDLWLPTKIEKQLRLANDAPGIRYVLTDYSLYFDGQVAERSHLSYAPSGYWIPEQHQSGFVVRQPITGKLSAFQPSITSTPMVMRSLFDETGGFDPNATLWAEDTCFHFRCLSVVPFGVVPEVLMHYRRHPSAISADPDRQLAKTILVWEYMLANYPQAQPYMEELAAGLEAMRKEYAKTKLYRRRQKLKRLLLGSW